MNVTIIHGYLLGWAVAHKWLTRLLGFWVRCSRSCVVITAASDDLFCSGSFGAAWFLGSIEQRSCVVATAASSDLLLRLRSVLLGLDSIEELPVSLLLLHLI